MKNKTAQFSVKTKEAIFERDGWCCIVCWEQPHSIHHVFFSTESNYWPNRNDPDQWVTLCHKHHQWKEWCHGCTRWEWVRQFCIDYLDKYYTNN